MNATDSSFNKFFKKNVKIIVFCVFYNFKCPVFLLKQDCKDTCQHQFAGCTAQEDTHSVTCSMTKPLKNTCAAALSA